jgi:putative DNA primase/helicase
VKAVTDAELRELNRRYADPAGSRGSSGSRVKGGLVGPLAVRKASEFTPTVVRWLWDQRIAYGKLNVLGGPPGVGKSYLTCCLASAVSRGRRMPGDRRPTTDPQRAVLLSYEDDPEDTLRPRLDLLDADLDRVEIVEGVNHEGKVRTFGVDDVRLLADYIAANDDIGLVVIDPVSAFVGAGTDEHRGNEVRAALEELRVVAQVHGIAVVLLMHTRKSAADTALNRLSGSQAYGALVRSALMAGPIPDDDQDRNALAHVKHNLSAKQPTLAYSVDASGLTWHGEVDLDGEEVAGNSDGTDRSASDEAAAFLRDVLADGPVTAKQVLAEARDAGIAEKTLKRAKKRLGIASIKQADRWTWELPK